MIALISRVSAQLRLSKGVQVPISSFGCVFFCLPPPLFLILFLPNDDVLITKRCRDGLAERGDPDSAPVRRALVPFLPSAKSRVHVTNSSADAQRRAAGKGPMPA